MHEKTYLNLIRCANEILKGEAKFHRLRSPRRGRVNEHRPELAKMFCVHLKFAPALENMQTDVQKCLIVIEHKPPMNISAEYRMKIFATL